MTRSFVSALCLVGCGIPILLAGCGPREGAPHAHSVSDAGTGSEDGAPAIPEPDTTGMETQVADRLRQVRAAVIAQPEAADAWGRFGMVCHAHELWDCADSAYRQAVTLDPTDERWHYYLGDVLSVVGTDLQAAERAFRRVMELYPDHAPTHLRLGRVLVADNRPAGAAKQFERALELDPDLQPARLALAQIRLAEGRLEDAREMLETLLRGNLRNEQGLSTLGRVYMLQGQRSEAREIASRAREAAAFNLYSDPLMGQVVAEGRSSVLLWDRAKAFFRQRRFRASCSRPDAGRRAPPGQSRRASPAGRGASQ